MSPTSEEPRHRDASIDRREDSARSRGTGASSETADFDSSGKLSALSVWRGFPTPPIARRAPDGGGSGGGWLSGGVQPSPHLYPRRRRAPTSRQQERLGALCARHSPSTSQEPARVPMTTRVRFSPRFTPLSPFASGRTRHRTPRGNRFWFCPALRSSFPGIKRAESNTDRDWNGRSM